jgi:hypothetical protein
MEKSPKPKETEFDKQKYKVKGKVNDKIISITKR